MGILGRFVVWSLATLLFGGGLVGWFLAVSLVEAHVGSSFSMFDLGESASSINVKEYLAMSGLEEGDAEFLAEQYGLDPETMETSVSADEYVAYYEDDADLSATILGTGERTQSTAAEALVDWPDYLLSGVMAGNGSKPGRVILDGHLIPVGELFHGVEVIAVERNGAVLLFEGDQQWFSSGQRTGK